MERLEQHWLEWLDPEMREFVESHYGEPHRHYHTMRHINTLLSLAVLCGYSKPMRKLNMWPTLSAAIVFHDIIYDPKATGGQNEIESAVLARLRLADVHMAGLDHELVGRMIEATANHYSEDSFIQDFLDLDMSILAEKPPIYHEYARAVRREYAHVPLDLYVKGRTDFLGKQLDREHIFFFETRHDDPADYFAATYHNEKREHLMDTSRAHYNIAAEIAYLQRQPLRYLREATS